LNKQDKSVLNPLLPLFSLTKPGIVGVIRAGVKVSQHSPLWHPGKINSEVYVVMVKCEPITIMNTKCLENYMLLHHHLTLTHVRCMKHLQIDLKPVGIRSKLRCGLIRTLTFSQGGDEWPRCTQKAVEA
jgi:hypothetical protein